MRGTDATSGVHAHIEGAVVEEAEATLGVIQLRRGNAEIEQDAIDSAGQTTLGKLARHLGETALHNDKAAVFGRQRLPGGNRLRILVEPEEATSRAEVLQNQPTVSTASEGAIQIAAIRAHRKSLDGLVQKYGDVVKAAIYSHRIKSRSSSGMAPGC